MKTKISVEDILRNKALADCVALVADGVHAGRLSCDDAVDQLLEMQSATSYDDRLVDGTHIGDVFRDCLTIAICHEDGSVTVQK